MQIIGDDIRTYDLNAVVQAFFDVLPQILEIKERYKDSDMPAEETRAELKWRCHQMYRWWTMVPACSAASGSGKMGRACIR